MYIISRLLFNFLSTICILTNQPELLCKNRRQLFFLVSISSIVHSSPFRPSTCVIGTNQYSDPKYNIFSASEKLLLLEIGFRGITERSRRLWLIEGVQNPYLPEESETKIKTITGSGHIRAHHIIIRCYSLCSDFSEFSIC